MSQQTSLTGEGDQHLTRTTFQNSRKLRSWTLPPKSLRFLLIVLLILGIFFRFVNLERKFYWHDEIYSSMRISGFSQAEMMRQVYNGSAITSKELQKYQYPNSEKNLIDSIFHSGIPEPQLPPLYFTLTRFWVQIFGNSVTATRSFSAFVSLLAFPSIYWLCLELFESSLVGWIAIGIIAVSPFFVLYAQEARPYSLWTVLILLSSASLLRAMRVKTKESWGVYTATLILGLYSFLFFTFVAIAHGIYVLAMESFKVSKTLKAYLLSSLIGIVPFVPWILFTVLFWRAAAWGTIGTWGPKKVTLWALIQTWTINLSRIFLDVSVDCWAVLRNPLSYLIIVLIGYSIYFLCSHTAKRVWLFVLSLMGVMGLALATPDLVLRGILSGVMRYSIPAILGIQLAVAYLFATKVFSTSIKWQQRLWVTTMLAVFTLEVVSCTAISQAEYWWNKGADVQEPEMARIINRANKPLLISEKINTLGFSHRLEPKVGIQLVYENNIPKIPNNYSDIFLYRPSDSLRSGVEKQYHTKANIVIMHTQQMDPVLHFTSSLWKLEKQ